MAYAVNKGLNLMEVIDDFEAEKAAAEGIAAYYKKQTEDALAKANTCDTRIRNLKNQLLAPLIATAGKTDKTGPYLQVGLKKLRLVKQAPQLGWNTGWDVSRLPDAYREAKPVAYKLKDKSALIKRLTELDTAIKEIRAEDPPLNDELQKLYNELLAERQTLAGVQVINAKTARLC